jgi:uroporphyrin-III C-methyltransferase
MSEPAAQEPAATPAGAAPSNGIGVSASAPEASSAAGWLNKRSLTFFFIALTAFSIVLSGGLWLKLSNMQEALARQSFDATAASLEGRTLAKSAQESVKEIATRQALLETRLSEVALQRGQLEDLMQSLSRSRDENLVVDVDAALRLAQQQANLTGSLEPLLAALRSAEQRTSRAAQPRLAPLLRALAQDLERIKSANVADTPSLLIKLDELVRLVDEMPLANAVAASSKATTSTLPTRDIPANESIGSGILSEAPQWLKTLVGAVRAEARALVRVSRIDTPEVALLSPEQSFFARENLKLKLLNARLSLLARQFDAARNDLASAASLSKRYFEASSRAALQSNNLLAQLQSQLERADQPRIDNTLAALATLSAVTAQK